MKLLHVIDIKAKLDLLRNTPLHNGYTGRYILMTSSITSGRKRLLSLPLRGPDISFVALSTIFWKCVLKGLLGHILLLSASSLLSAVSPEGSCLLSSIAVDRSRHTPLSRAQPSRSTAFLSTSYDCWDSLQTYLEYNTLIIWKRILLASSRVTEFTCSEKQCMSNDVCW